MKKQEKTQNTWILVTLCLIVLFGLLRLFGILDMYSIPTGANTPTIRPGSIIFATNLIKPQRNNFICFKANHFFTGVREQYVSRLVATAGDSVEIKDGVLFINGNNADAGLPLYHTWLVPDNEVYKLSDKEPDVEIISRPDSETALLAFTEQYRNTHHIPAQRDIYPVAQTDTFIKAYWHQNWNADHFGPVTVPTGCLFVLGDYRHNSLDSRYRGFVSVADYVSTVLWK